MLFSRVKISCLRTWYFPGAYIINIIYIFFFNFFVNKQITTKDFQVCVKELHNQNGYDPVKVAALIIGKDFSFISTD